jgi:hypothetical protein
MSKEKFIYNIGLGENKEIESSWRDLSEAEKQEILADLLVLQKAVRSSDFDAVEFLVEKASSAQQRNIIRNGKSMVFRELIEYTRRDNLPGAVGLFRYLYAKGQELGLSKEEMLSHNDYQILGYAAMSGNIPLFDFIYAEIASIDDKALKPALSEAFEWAICQKQKVMVTSMFGLMSFEEQREILKKNLKTNIYYIINPLTWAAQENDLELVKLLAVKANELGIFTDCLRGDNGDYLPITRSLLIGSNLDVAFYLAELATPEDKEKILKVIDSNTEAMKVINRNTRGTELLKCLKNDESYVRQFPEFSSSSSSVRSCATPLESKGAATSALASSSPSTSAASYTTAARESNGGSAPDIAAPSGSPSTIVRSYVAGVVISRGGAPHAAALSISSLSSGHSAGFSSSTTWAVAEISKAVISQAKPPSR